MEPISILSAASAVSAVAGKSWELVNWIRDLYQGSKTVDERVRRLESGMTELASACQSVLAAIERKQPGSSSKTPVPSWDEDGSSAISIDRQVSNCQKTLKELERVLAPLRSGSSGRLSRHMKMQDRGRDIDELSARIKTHTDALQMSLQTVIIKIVLASPDFVLRQLDEALQDIRTRLARMEPKRYQPIGRKCLTEENEDPLIDLAQDALRRGTTLYNASIAGSSIGVDSAMGSEKAVSIGRWIQSTDAALDEWFRLTPGASRVCTPTIHYSVEDTISKASSAAETASDVGLSSWEGSQCESLPASEGQPASTLKPNPITKLAPTTKEPFDLPRPPTDFSRPLDQWDRSEILSKFNIKSDGQIEAMICSRTNVDPTELLCLAGSKFSGETDAGQKPRRRTLALHLAVLFQDAHLIESLIHLGYSPMCPAQVSDREPLRGLRTPFDIAIASHCEPVLKVLLKHGHIAPSSRKSPCLQLLATTSLDSWPSDDDDVYTRVLELLLASGFVWPNPPIPRSDGTIPWTMSILHQICDLPKAWFRLRRPLLILVLDHIARYWAPSANARRAISPIHVIIKIHDATTLDFFLRTSDAPYPIDNVQWNGQYVWSPLRYAIDQVAIRGDLDIVRALLKRGASLDVTSKEPSNKMWGSLWKQTLIRDIAMRSNRTELKKLIAKY